MPRVQVSCRLLPEVAVTGAAAAAAAAVDGVASGINAADSASSDASNSQSSDIPKVLLVDEATAAVMNLPPDDAVNAGAAFDWVQVCAICRAVQQDVTVGAATAQKRSTGLRAASC